MSCPLHSNDNSCAGCAKIKIKDLERQIEEAREGLPKCPKCKEGLSPYIHEDAFHGDALAWFCECEPRDLSVIEEKLKEKGE